VKLESERRPAIRKLCSFRARRALLEMRETPDRFCDVAARI
jgi:hypothetical protein